MLSGPAVVLLSPFPRSTLQALVTPFPLSWGYSGLPDPSLVPLSSPASAAPRAALFGAALPESGTASLTGQSSHGPFLAGPAQEGRADGVGGDNYKQWIKDSEPGDLSLNGTAVLLSIWVFNSCLVSYILSSLHLRFFCVPHFEEFWNLPCFSLWLFYPSFSLVPVSCNAPFLPI